VLDYDEAKRWVNLAKRDHAIALHLRDTFVPLPVETICFHCQQTAEKALKAVLAYHNADIPKTHDITKLDGLCQEFTDKVQTDARIAETLTTFAVITRYVEDRHDFTEDTAQFALKQAKQVLDNVKETLGITE